MTRLPAAAVVALGSVIWIASADASQITSVNPSSGSTAGGTTITINGNGFSAAGNAVSIGSVACPVTSEASDEIQCTLPEGSGASRPIQVVGGGAASPPFPFAYKPPAITSVTAASAPATGGFSLTIIGADFGPAAASRRVIVNGSVAKSCAADPLTPHSQVVCTAPAGLGHDVPVDITVDGQTSPPSPFSYDAPVITSVTPTHGPAAGGRTLTISGSNWYTLDSDFCSAAIRVGASPCPITNRTVDRLECDLPPGSAGLADVSVSAGCQNSNSVSFTYGVTASKCDAAKLKSVTSYAQCLGNTESNAAKKGVDPDPKAVAKCDDKFTTSCGKAESNSTDCSQLDTCDALAAGTGRKGWDGLIYGTH